MEVDSETKILQHVIGFKTVLQYDLFNLFFGKS